MRENGNQLPPLPFWAALILFGIPSVVFFICTRVGIPLLERVGFPALGAFGAALGLPLAGLLAASLLAFRLEGHSWDAFKARFRLGHMKLMDWVWTAGLVAFMGATYYVLSPTSRWLAVLPFFAPPEFFPPAFDPRLHLTPHHLDLAQGLSVWTVGMTGAFLFFNVVGEEFWWRGYILPRQELVHGKRTWIIHGLLWTVFHVFFPWNLVAVLPSALALSFVAQRRRNTWPGMIAHALLNTVGTFYWVISLATGK